MAAADEGTMRNGDLEARGLSRVLTGLAAGALMAALLVGASAAGALVGLPSVAYAGFEWLTRVMPGRLVIFGLETTLSALETLGFDIKDTTKTVEGVLAYTGLFATAALAGLVFFLVVRTDERGRARLYGALLGAVAGVAALAVVLAEAPPAPPVERAAGIAWVVGLFAVWGLGLARLYVAATPSPGLSATAVRAAAEGGGLAAAKREKEDAESATADTTAAGASVTAAPRSAWPAADVERLDRRRFLIRVGGLVATVTVAGAELAEVLRVESGGRAAKLAEAPIPFPNADSPVQPVPGTRPEYVAPADHYSVDINLSPPEVDAASWRLRIAGQVAEPVSLTLDQLRSDYPAVSRFITLSCVSNPVGGPLIGTTLWTGARFRDVLDTVTPLPAAAYAHVRSVDGFDESIDLDSLRSDPRVMLVYAWNGEPLTREHGFPLRLYRPGRYGMKQPKWITDIALVKDEIEGYWVQRGWDAVAEMRTTSFIDVVESERLLRRGGQTLVPVGGIAHAGDRGISKVEVRVDDGPWESAELRAPLSGLTWVIWRYEWPFSRGEHVFAVRAYDGAGALQPTERHDPFPGGASGVDTESASLLQVEG